MRFDTIRDIPMLSGVGASVLEAFEAEGRLKIRQYIKGVTVHRQHEDCTVLDIVLLGSLAAYSLSENGSAMNLFSFTRGAAIGANLLFGDRNQYPLNIYSVTDCSLVQMERTVVKELLGHTPFVMEYIKSLSLNAQGMNRRISMMMHHTLRENLLQYLKHQSIAQNTRNITLPITKKQLADYLGVQRPSLFRELKKLKEEGMISCKNREITLLGD